MLEETPQIFAIGLQEGLYLTFQSENENYVSKYGPFYSVSGSKLFEYHIKSYDNPKPLKLFLEYNKPKTKNDPNKPKSASHN